MTRVNGFKCDNGSDCVNVVSNPYQVMFNHTQFDFCSLDCLISWAEDQKKLNNSFPARISAVSKLSHFYK